MNTIHFQSTPSSTRKLKPDYFGHVSSESETFTSYFESSTSHSTEKIFPPKPAKCSGSSAITLRQDHKYGFNALSHPSDCSSFNLNAWEQWLMNKLQLEQENLKQKKMEAKREKEEAERNKKEKEERVKAAERRHQEWVEESLLKMKLQISAAKREKKIQKEIELEKKERLKADMEVNFQRWKDKVERVERRKRLQDKAEREKAARLKEEKKKVAEEKYQEWLESNKHRFLALEDIASRAPAFVNPNPWIGPNHDEVLKLSSSLTEQPSPTHRSQASSSAKTKPKKQTCHRDANSPTMNADGRHGSHAVGFIRATSAPLRYAGSRPKTRSQTYVGVKPARNKQVKVLQPLNGMQYAVTRESTGSRTR